MRIDGPRNLTKANKKSSQVKSSGGARFVVGGGMQAAGLSGGQSISNIGALLAAQEVDGVSGQTSRTLKRGHEMLDILDQVKIGLLAGRISPAKLNRLRSLVGEKARQADGSQLRPIMQAIELRAEVELAKLANTASKTGG